MTAFAQDEDAQDRASWKVPTTYLNIGYVESKLKQDDWEQLKSDWGASITIGKTFFLHKKPIANFIRLGIDATWFDLTYANYKLDYDFKKEKPKCLKQIVFWLLFQAYCSPSVFVLFTALRIRDYSDQSIVNTQSYLPRKENPMRKDKGQPTMMREG